MTDNEKSTDPGLSAAERKELEVAKLRRRLLIMKKVSERFTQIVNACGQSAWSGRRRRDRCSHPAPELPDNTPIDTFDFLRGSKTH